MVLGGGIVHVRGLRLSRNAKTCHFEAQAVPRAKSELHQLLHPAVWLVENSADRHSQALAKSPKRSRVLDTYMYTTHSRAFALRG